MKSSTILKRLKGFSNASTLDSGGNQITVKFQNGSLFKSYGSIIAVKMNDKVYLGRDWDYSKTTGKYRNEFLNEGIAETREKIKSGEYKMLTY